MTDASLPAGRFIEGDFRVGHVVSRAWSVLSRNFLSFFVVTAVAAMPQAATGTVGDPFEALQVEGLGALLGVLLSPLSQAVVLYGAFQAMRGKRVDLGESIRIGLRRFFPVVGVMISVTLLGFLGLIAFVVPGLICFTMWFVAIPACVVEGRGVSSSVERSAELTRGYRWKIFGLMPLWFIFNAIADQMIDLISTSVAGGIPAFAVHVIWNGFWGAFYAIFVVVTYHDLRVAKEGVDTEQIASVFE
jgi:hypothetical protein